LDHARNWANMRKYTYGTSRFCQAAGRQRPIVTNQSDERPVGATTINDCPGHVCPSKSQSVSSTQAQKQIVTVRESIGCTKTNRDKRLCNEANKCKDHFRHPQHRLAQKQYRPCLAPRPINRKTSCDKQRKQLEQFWTFIPVA